MHSEDRGESGEELLATGRVVKPHGLRGELVVDLVSNRPERTKSGSEFDAGGQTLRLVSSRPFGRRWLMKFEGIDSLQTAEKMRGLILRAHALSDPDALWVHELVGARVERTDGTALGEVAAVIANPASDLLELSEGGLIPVRFVVSHRRGTIVVDLPEGLL